jgi:hypothetical protein
MAGLRVQTLSLAILLLWALQCSAAVNRTRIVKRFNPHRDHGNHDTPLQVGNGNFAFGADVTGLQSIKRFNTLSSWGWHTSRPPPGVKTSNTIRRTVDRGVELLDCAWLHGKALIKGVLPDSLANSTEHPLQSEKPETLEAWEARNPHRINLARLGLQYLGREISLSQISDINQTLELPNGILKSSFSIANQTVEVDTVASPLFDAVAFNIRSTTLIDGALQFFIDFPFPNEHKKFEAPYMGDYGRETFGKHKTEIKKWGQSVEVRHDIEDTTYFANVRWGGSRAIPDFQRVGIDSHRFFINSSDILELSVSVRFSPISQAVTPAFDDIRADSTWFWNNFWKSGAFVDCSATNDDWRAKELLRRTYLSQYLMAVNAAGSDPPQESGLVNNGWYGKFHLESVLWNMAHWERWGRWERIGTAVPWIYQRLLNGVMARRSWKQDGLNKWDNPAGKSADKVNDVSIDMIRELPHPFYFAELEWVSFPDNHTLAKWKDILEDIALLVVSSTRKDEQTHKYDLFITSEGPPNSKNPTFELAYWRFALRVASDWYKRQNLPVPELLSNVHNNLAHYPVANDSYLSFEKADSFSPSISGMFGLLPPDRSLNLTIFQNTLWSIYRSHSPQPNSQAGSNLPTPSLFGTDFPTLAMTAIRMGDSSRAVDLLLDRGFRFDDAGYPVGKILREEEGGRDDAGTPQTPYFPSSGGLLMTVAMLANGWKDTEGRKWPNGWTCEAEGFGLGI